MKRKRKILVVVLFVLVSLTLWKILFYSPFEERECRRTEEACQVCYLLNLDGMKGLGHSALLLIDEEGFGKVFSYNGMQYNLAECLAGSEGIGKMMEYTLEPQKVDDLLRTGDLEAGDYAECDNFDRMLYRWISRDQYEQILCAAEDYVKVGDQYEELYAAVYNAEEAQRQEAEAEMEVFLAQDLPHYQIYTHNCDTVARELLAVVDEELQRYNAKEQKLTPKGNYKNMCSYLSTRWGIARLGEDSLAEKLLDL